MNEKKVVVYTQTGCPECNAAKEFLSQEGIDFEEKNIRNDEAMRELNEKYNSSSTPTILVDDEVIIGFDKEELERVLS